MILSAVSHPIWRFNRGMLLGVAFALQGCQTLSFFQDGSFIEQRAELVESHDFSVLNKQEMVGTLASVASQEDDTLSDLARHFGLGFTDISIANAQLDPWALDEDQEVLLPLQFILPDAPHKGVVLNLANMRLFYYPKHQGRVLTYPVGIGRDGWHTPLGNTKIVSKKAKPVWTVPQSILREHLELGEPLPKVVPAGPDNPLGEYAMRLGFSGYLIHGTNKPYGIGMQVSHGCVQLYPEDVEDLFKQVDVGTPVRIVHQPYLAAWDGDMLYLEAHEPLQKWMKQDKKLQKAMRNDLRKMVAQTGSVVDWERVDAILQRKDGIPTPVLQGSPELDQLYATAVKVRHPVQLYGKPVVNELSEYDWAILTPSLNNEAEAEKLAAMLNHLGPQIPARIVEQDGAYKVAAGPFKDRKATRAAAKRIKSSFDMDVLQVKPKPMRN